VTGLLTSKGALLLPGDSFTLRDTARLRDYLDRVLADGAEAMTAPRGSFGLTKQEFEAAFKKLGQPITFATKERTLAELLGEAQRATRMQLAVPDGLRPTLARLKCRDDLRTLSLGCGLAIALKAEGLAMAPEKPRGAPVRLAVRFQRDLEEPWPIGWPSKASPSQLAPALFTKINVEIDGFSLQEAVDAIGPRLEVPVLWDHAALAAKRIDPAAKQVKLPRTRLSYGRILDKLLFQARLHGELRVDEAGAVFYWISR
jgi:hypothetical protein